MSRILIAGILVFTVVFTFRTPRGLLQSLRGFLITPAAPLNLAVLRVIVFSVVLQKTRIGYVAWLSAVPGELLNPPWGMAWLMQAIPPDPANVKLAAGLMSLVCALGIAGFGSKTCAAIAAALSVYVLGIPQCVGKVAHYNHLIWFLTLLAVTPCGDALSIDAVIRRRGARRALLGITTASTAYGFPLRVAALLIGFIYLFPGLWKVWDSGVDWISSDNLLNLVWRHGELEGIRRAHWLAGYPALLKLGGSAVLLFELGFAFALFWPRLLPWAVVAGILFHIANWYVLDILFHPLLACYVLFVDWARLANRFVSGNSALRLGGNDTNECYGTRLENLRTRPARAAIAVSLILISCVVYAGARGITEGWPFACYPTFAGIERPQVRAVSLEIPNGRESKLVDIEALRMRVGPVRWERWISWMLDTPGPEARNGRLRSFVRWCVREIGVPASVHDVRLYELVYNVSGGQRALVSRTIAY